MPATTANNRPASETPNPWDIKELGCLWKKKSKKDESYFTGVIDMKKVVANLKVKTLEELLKYNLDLICFQNKRKTKDTHPDVRVYWSEPRESASAPAAAPRRQAAPAPAPADSNELI